MTAVLRVAAGCRLATHGGRRDALAFLPGDVVTLGPGVTRRVRHALRTVLVQDSAAPLPWLVSVAAGSLGEGLPATDLVVAPDQILPVAGGMGVPARYLIDGVAVGRVEPLGRHDLVDLHLDAPIAACASEAALPGLVEAVVSARLPPAGSPQGGFDHAGHDHAAGWAWDPARPGQPLLLALEIDGAPRALLLADAPRDDPMNGAQRGADHGFRCAIAPALSRKEYHHLVIRRAWDGASLPGGDLLLDRAPPAGAALAALATRPPAARARALSAALMALGGAAHA